MSKVAGARPHGQEAVLRKAVLDANENQKEISSHSLAGPQAKIFAFKLTSRRPQRPQAAEDAADRPGPAALPLRPQPGQGRGGQVPRARDQRAGQDARGPPEAGMN